MIQITVIIIIQIISVLYQLLYLIMHLFKKIFFFNINDDILHEIWYQNETRVSWGIKSKPVNNKNSIWEDKDN